MKWDKDYWDTTWSRPLARYNRHHREIWDAMLPLLKGSVVDLGCGSCTMYQGTSVQLTGVDWSAEALNQARLNYPQGIYIQAPAHDSGLPTGQYDTVIMMGLLDYCDWEPIVKEARRLSRHKIYATLLNGFFGHDWTSYPHVCGNWHLAELSR